MESVLKSRLGMFCAALALVAISGAAVADEVADRAKDPNLWAAPGGDTELTRHSRLKDINATNVHKLQMIWSQSSGTLRVCTFKIAARPRRSGRSTTTRRSKRPGRSSAGSRTSARFEAATTTTASR